MSRTESGIPSDDQSIFEVEAEEGISKQEKYFRLFDAWVYAPLRVMLSDWRGIVGLSVVVFFILLGTVGVWVIPEPAMNKGGKLQPWFESFQHPLGTDNLSRDLLSMIVHATPPMLQMIISGGIFATAVATVVGTVSGYKRGFVDTVLMVITDIMLTIPGLPLVMVLAIAIEPENPWVIGIVLTINAWAGLARAVRSQVLSLREESYVEASRLMGISTTNIVVSDLLPNLMPYILINFVQAARGVIFSSVGLYYLGVLPFSTSNWGIILNQAYQWGALADMSTMHWIFVPIIVIGMLSLGLILLSQSLDQVFNPRVRARRQRTASSDETIDR
jgi:peptide/nickel transport system permease protein